MAQMATLLPSTNLHTFQTNRARLQRQRSRLNPALVRPVLSAASSGQPGRLEVKNNKTHLSALEKLLVKNDDDDHRAQSRPKPRPEKPVLQVPNTGQEPEDGRGLWGLGLAEMIDLARRLPEGVLGRAGELAADVSPRQLKRLQRLLSMQPEYSPRARLGARWREYHGSRDWAGLLDPLDENLRREVVRYGEFVQAAYQAFNVDPATTKEGIGSLRPVNLPDGGSYKMTKCLYATSSLGFPKWVDDVAPNLEWMTQRSSWVGYVAVCEDEREIARMGRRDIVIALRGTSTCLEWAENARDLLVPMDDDNTSGSDSNPGHGQAKAECGFLSLFCTPGEHVPSLAESVVQEIRRLLKVYEGETLSITITGHSLGAALALLVADEISTCAPDVPPVAVFSFGGPRVGNRSFADRITNKNVKVLRIVNNQDIITKVPGMFVSEELSQKLREKPQIAKVLDALDAKMPWAYAHVGTELKVDTKKSPYLKPNVDVACCHDLEAYLHLVDGFLASNSPFRPNAKRSLWKLVNEQRANMKTLYTSKSKKKSLTLEIGGDGQIFMSKCMLSPSLQHEMAMPSPSLRA